MPGRYSESTNEAWEALNRTLQVDCPLLGGMESVCREHWVMDSETYTFTLLRVGMLSRAPVWFEVWINDVF